MKSRQNPQHSNTSTKNVESEGGLWIVIRPFFSSFEYHFYRIIITGQYSELEFQELKQAFDEFDKVKIDDGQVKHCS